MKPLHVEMQPGLKYLGWGGGALWTLCCVGSGLSGEWWPFLEFLFFLGLSIFLIAMQGPLEADYEGIWQTTPAGRYEMKWSEVAKIETDLNDHMVLHAPNKRLAIPGPTAWREEGRAEMVLFIESQIKAWSIPREQTTRASLQASKNAKVPRSQRRPPLSP